MKIPFTREQIIQGNVKLTEVADFIEVKAPEFGYDQTCIGCLDENIPGCFLLYSRWFGVSFPLRLDIYAITEEECTSLIARDGCGNAGRDWKKAVAFIRNMVVERQKAIEAGVYGA